jgi:hypothetical protein
VIRDPRLDHLDAGVPSIEGVNEGRVARCWQLPAISLDAAAADVSRRRLAPGVFVSVACGRPGPATCPAHDDAGRGKVAEGLMIEMAAGRRRPA